MAKDKTPNKTLSIAISAECGYKDCENHATVSKSADGIVVRRCLNHHNATKIDENDYLPNLV